MASLVFVSEHSYRNQQKKVDWIFNKNIGRDQIFARKDQEREFTNSKSTMAIQTTRPLSESIIELFRMSKLLVT